MLVMKLIEHENDSIVNYKVKSSRGQVSFVAGHLLFLSFFIIVWNNNEPIFLFVKSWIYLNKDEVISQTKLIY